MFFKETVCPRCETLLSREQQQALQKKRRRGGILGTALGIIGGLTGAALGFYFAAAG